MYLKTRTGLLPSFQPYQSFHVALSQWVGANVPAIVPWALSFVNGMTILGFLFARMNRLLPGRNGALKGLTFGLLGWVFMNLIFFPVIGLGPFAMNTNVPPANIIRCRSRSRSRRRSREGHNQPFRFSALEM
jgi:hypothetical protein